METDEGTTEEDHDPQNNIIQLPAGLCVGFEGEGGETGGGEGGGVHTTCTVSEDLQR